MFPKLYSGHSSRKSYGHSITVSDTLNSVFMGGGFDTNKNEGFVMRVNLDHNRVKWRKAYGFSDASMNQITAMAVNPDGTSLACYGSLYDDDRSENLWIWTIRTSDGMIEYDALKYTLGPSGIANHYSRDSGLVYTSSGSVLMALFHWGTTSLDSDDGTITNYAGRMIVASYNPSLSSLDWVLE